MTEPALPVGAAPAAADPTYRRSAEVVARTIAGEFFLVPVKGRLADLQKIFTVNAVGERVWEALDGRTSAAAICRLVADSFESGEADVCEDVRAFLHELSAAGLIEQV